MILKYEDVGARARGSPQGAAKQDFPAFISLFRLISMNVHRFETMPAMLSSAGEPPLVSCLHLLTTHL